MYSDQSCWNNDRSENLQLEIYINICTTALNTNIICRDNCFFHFKDSGNFKIVQNATTKPLLWIEDAIAIKQFLFGLLLHMLAHCASKNQIGWVTGVAIKVITNNVGIPDRFGDALVSTQIAWNILKQKSTSCQCKRKR
jgi:hypothetical protein